MTSQRNILFEHRGAYHAVNYILHLAKEMGIEEKFIKAIEEIREQYIELIKKNASAAGNE